VNWTGKNSSAVKTEKDNSDTKKRSASSKNFVKVPMKTGQGSDRGGEPVPWEKLVRGVPGGGRDFIAEGPEEKFLHNQIQKRTSDSNRQNQKIQTMDTVE